MMRSKIDFHIFSGMNKLEFTVKEERLKEQVFERICINGVPTSYTTTMGPTWKEDWYVLREIYCNALDEGNCTLIKDTEIVAASEGKTRIYIEVTENLKYVSDNWDNYFADESVYHRTDGVLYRKGIRVYASKRYLFDYGVSAVNINEDRTAKNPTGLHYGIYHLLSSFANEGYVKSVLRTSQDDEMKEEYLAISCGETTYEWSKDWIEFSQNNLLAMKESCGRYSEEISMSKKECFLLPYCFAKEMKKHLPEVFILGMSGYVDGVLSHEVVVTPKMNFLLKEVVASLKEMNYDVPFDISIVDFEEEHVLGRAHIKDKKILLSQKVFDMGRREIAMTLMEEVEHIRSGEGDETRAFQTHIFSQWLKTMEDNNGLFL
jgi:hypothetical protein